MSNITGTVRARATIEQATAPTIYNVTVVSANTEISHTLSDNTKSFLIRVRGHSTLKLAFNSGESGTNYFTVAAGSNYLAEGLNFSGNIYFQTNKASQIVEILEWV